MGLVASLLISLAALALFALAMPRHHRELTGRAPPPRTILLARIAGWVLLVLAPVPWMAAHGAWMAFVAWIFCVLPVAGLAVVAITTWLPGRVRPR